MGGGAVILDDVKSGSLVGCAFRECTERRECAARF